MRPFTSARARAKPIAKIWRTPVEKAFNPDEARDEHGRWTDGGGTVGTDITGHIVTSHGKPVVIHSLDEAVDRLAHGKGVMFERPKEAVVFLHKLQDIAADARARGATAPVYNLCGVYVKGTNLFCSDSLRIPRSEMPQLSGKPLPGSPGDNLPKDDRGEVDLNHEFLHYLKGKGIDVEKVKVPADELRASQNELDGAKVASIMGKYEAKGPSDRRIFVSKENYIVDGHHHWAADVGLALEGENPKVRTWRVDMPAVRLLKEANTFALKMGIPPRGLGKYDHDGHGCTVRKSDIVSLQNKRGAFAKVWRTPVEKADEGDYDYTWLHDTADHGAIEAARKFLEATRWLRQTPNAARMLSAIESGSVDAVMATFPGDAVLHATMANYLLPPLLEVLETTGQGTLEADDTLWRRAAEIEMRFDVINPHTVDAAKTYGFDLIRQINEDTRAGIRQIVTDAMEFGGHPYDQARDIRELIGLTDSQAQAVSNFRTMLENRDPEALTRALRDARFDSTLTRALGDSATADLSPEQIDRMVERYASRMLDFRAQNIARTESLRAANIGQNEAWWQARERGLIGDTTKRQWLVTPDDRLCIFCASIPAMNPGGVLLEEPFKTVLGDCDEPPLHPQCRCVTVLDDFGDDTEKRDVRKDNPYHVPAGSPQGGQFTSAGDVGEAATAMARAGQKGALATAIGLKPTMVPGTGAAFAEGQNLVDHGAPFVGGEPGMAALAEGGASGEHFVTGGGASVSSETGGDEWASQTAARLESEYQAAKPKIDAIVQNVVENGAGAKEPEPKSWAELNPVQQHNAMMIWTGKKSEPADYAQAEWSGLNDATKFKAWQDLHVEPDESGDEEEAPYVPEDWSGLADHQQEAAANEWKSQHKDSYIEDEQNQWWENDAPHEAAQKLAGDDDYIQSMVNDWWDQRVENGESVPHGTKEDLADAITLSDQGDYGDSYAEGGKPYGQHKGAPWVDVEFNDKSLEAAYTPSGTESEPQFAGFEKPTYSKLMTDEMRSDLTSMFASDFNAEGLDFKHTFDKLEVPDYVGDNVDETLDEGWESYDNSEKFQYWKDHVATSEELGEGDGIEVLSGSGSVTPSGSTSLHMPKSWEPITNAEGAEYRNLRLLSLDTANRRAADLIAERGVKIDGVAPGDPSYPSADALAGRASQIDSKLWQSWKGSSQAPHAKIMQQAVADELGARSRYTWSEAQELRHDGDSYGTSIGGYEGYKALARAKWETTQYLLDKSGKQNVDLYRAIMVDDDSLAHAATEKVGAGGYTRLNDFTLKRNALASMTADRQVANDWNGVDVNVSGTPVRVVLRANVPRTAVYSLPVYGQNLQNEQEVVVAGTAWHKWDAWRNKAPAFDQALIKFAKGKSGNIVLDIPDFPHWLAHEAKKTVFEKRVLKPVMIIKYDPGEARDAKGKWTADAIAAGLDTKDRDNLREGERKLHAMNVANAEHAAAVVASGASTPHDKTTWRSTTLHENYFGHGDEEVRVAVNPTEGDVRRIAAKDEEQGVRMYRSPDGNIYAWPANLAIHSDITRALDIPEARKVGYFAEHEGQEFDRTELGLTRDENDKPHWTVLIDGEPLGTQPPPAMIKETWFRHAVSKRFYGEIILKYDPDQPRVPAGQHGGGQFGSGGSPGLTQLSPGDPRAPMSRTFDEAVNRIANKLLPEGWDVSATAPNTYHDLVEHYAKTGRMEVWSGGSDKTVFGNDQSNYAFRAWHDFRHLSGMHNFTEGGEQGALNEMLKDVHDEYGDGPKAQRIARYLDEEILGQLNYTGNHGGQFPVNQRAFAASYFADPAKAVRSDFSKRFARRSGVHDAYGWGRLRDVQHGSDHLPTDTILARMVSNHLNGRVAKFDPEQARDDHGRWTSAAFASPSVVPEKKLAGAIDDIGHVRHKLFTKAAKEIDGELGIVGSQSDVVGAWADGAENSTMTISPTASAAQMRLSAAMKGWLGEQKQVLVFERDPQGPNAMYDLTVPGTLEATHQALLKAGVPFHTLAASPQGTRVLVADLDGSLARPVDTFAGDHGVVAERTFGKADFIGDQEGTGSDATQRQHAREAYEAIIKSSEGTPQHSGRTTGAIWRGIRDRWSAQIANVRKRLIAWLSRSP